MRFDCAIKAAAGGFLLDATIVSDAKLVALVGPSGAGKTTFLNAAAGLIRPSEGHVRIAGATLFDRGARIDVPAHRRRLGYVFQDGRLFPHLRVQGNLRYGRRFVPEGEAHVEEAAVIELLGLERLLHRWPATLSGGEKQRTAIARALMTSPRALLLDEPFASLDAARKGELLPYVERLRDELDIPILLVSHDRAEVDRLAREVVMMDGGRVVSPAPAG
jgi:molybdate transport system ATP-binding protein